MRVTRFEMRDGGSARSAGLRCAQRWIALRAALDCVARSACGVPKGNLAMCEVRC